MRVLILDRPVPMPALSLLFLAGEWDMSFAWATPGALLLSRAPGEGEKKAPAGNERRGFSTGVT